MLDLGGLEEIGDALMAAGKQLYVFGQYGNQDSGPGGSVKKPAIPLAWPETCVASDNYV